MSEVLNNCEQDGFSTIKGLDQSADNRLEMDPVNKGLPKLELGDKPVSFFEFWPAWFFYIPVVIYWLYLSVKYRSFGLPMAVNPNIELGGMVGESKIGILASMTDQEADYWLPFADFELSSNSIRDIEQLASVLIEKGKQKGVEFPFVIKPDMGCRGAGVSLVNNHNQLIQYLMAFPVGRKGMVQTLAPYSAEAGIFYERAPNESQGRITSVTLKYQPYVVGNGTDNLRKLIETDPRASHRADLYLKKNHDRLDWVPALGECVVIAFAGSHTRGSIFRNGIEFVTPEMEYAIDAMTKTLPEFNYGRIDIKFKDIHTLQKGEHFSLIEINGASSEATHIWDSRGTLKEAFSVLFGQYRTLFKFGDQMRKKGYKVPSALKLIRVWIRELRNGAKYPDSVAEL